MLSPCISHHVIHVISIMLPCSCLLVGPGFGHMSVGPSCMLHCIHVHKSLHAFRACHCCPRRCGVRPIKMQPFCASQQAASSISTQNENFSTFRQPTRAASARRSRACYALCLSVDKYLPVPDCRASTHILRAFYSADIGIPLTQLRFQP